MNPERTRVSRSELGSLKSCLVEGDPEQERRATQGKRRAVLVSIVVQLLVLTALVVFPLFSKGEHITFERTPLPPYHRLGPRDPHTNPRSNPPKPACHFCAPSSPDHPTIAHDPTSANEPSDDTPIIDAPGDPRGTRDGDQFVPPSSGPDPVIEKGGTEVREKRRISVGHIEPALLTTRVEPVYPRIAVTLRHETRVELHAIISTDGYIQSLEVLSGDPLFYRSALEAVRQWRYSATKLNGEPVEVDTHITVIYILNH